MAHFPKLKEKCLDAYLGAPHGDLKRLPDHLLAALIRRTDCHYWTDFKAGWPTLAGYLVQHRPDILSGFEVTMDEFLALSIAQRIHVRVVTLEAYSADHIAQLPDDAHVKLDAKNFTLEEIQAIPHPKAISLEACEWFKTGMFRELNNVYAIKLYPAQMCHAFLDAAFFPDLLEIEFQKGMIELADDDHPTFDVSRLPALLSHPAMGVFNLQHHADYWQGRDEVAAQTQVVQNLPDDMPHVYLLGCERLDLPKDVLGQLLHKFQHVTSAIVHSTPHLTTAQIIAFCKRNPALEQFALSEKDKAVDGELLQGILQCESLEKLYFRDVKITAALVAELGTPMRPLKVELSKVNTIHWPRFLSYFASHRLSCFEFSHAELSFCRSIWLMQQPNIHRLQFNDVIFSGKFDPQDFKDIRVPLIDIKNPKKLCNLYFLNLLKANPRELSLTLTQDSQIDYRVLDLFHQFANALPHMTQLTLDVPDGFWQEGREETEDLLTGRKAFYLTHCLSKNLEIALFEH